ncbi:MAG: MarR family winged helix-turn-helix transcriptional regulator [Streptosporangiaceae bacterium]
MSGPITARELAVRMCCEASNATYVIDRLEQQQLIERRPHPSDRRAKHIILTAAGRRCRNNVLRHLRTQSPLAPLTGPEQELLRDLLQQLVAPHGPETAPTGEL